MLLSLCAGVLPASTSEASVNGTQRRPFVDVGHFNREGYVVVDNVFTPSEIAALRAGVIRHKRQSGTKFSPLGPVDPGVTIPDFMSRSEFRFMHHLPHHPPLRRALNDVFAGEPYRYCSHNDVGINRVVSWHKDRLNDQYRRYQKLPLWGPGSESPDGGHFIVKALVYLQEHAHDDNGLALVSGSHRTPSMATHTTTRARPRLGSAVIFEQRLTHRGMSVLDAVRHHFESDKDDRILVSLGFGLRNNHTDEFEAGTLARQAAQCAGKCDYVHGGATGRPPHKAAAAAAKPVGGSRPPEPLARLAKAIG